MRLSHPAPAAARHALTLSLCVAAVAAAAAAQEAARPPLAMNTALVTIAGTSNIHDYTASTSVVRVTRAQLAPDVAGPAFWEEIVKPGALQEFEIAIPAATLTSDKDGLDKNMHKALKANQHAEITFRLLRIEPRTGEPGGLTAVGLLRIAGVEREVALDLATEPRESGLAVTGELQLLMTDYGITPPKAMLGMLRTDPKVTVRFEAVLGVAST